MGPHSRQVAFYAGIAPQAHRNDDEDFDEEGEQRDEIEASSDEEILSAASSPNESMKSSPVSSPLSSPPSSPIAFTSAAATSSLQLTHSLPFQQQQQLASSTTAYPHQFHAHGCVPVFEPTQYYAPSICAIPPTASFYPLDSWIDRDLEDQQVPSAMEEGFFLSADAPFNVGEEAASAGFMAMNDLELQQWISVLADGTDGMMPAATPMVTQEQRYAQLQQQQLQMQHEYLLRKRKAQEEEEWKEWLVLDQENAQCHRQLKTERFDLLPYVSNLYN